MMLKRLKSLFIIPVLLVLSIPQAFAIVNPFSSNISEKNIRQLNDFVDLLKSKKDKYESSRDYTSLLTKVQRRIDNALNKNLENDKLSNFLNYLKFEINIIIDSSIIEDKFNCKPTPNFQNANFHIGTPTISNQEWQNESIDKPCFYECKDGYSGIDCTVSDNKVITDYSVYYEPVVSTNILAGSKDVKIFSFKLLAENDNISITDLYFTGINISTLSNIRLMNMDKVIGQATFQDNDQIKFENMPNLPLIKKDTKQLYYIIADINSNINNIDLTLTLISDKSYIKGSNGRKILINGSNLIGPTHSISYSLGGVNKLENPSKDLNSSGLVFNVKAFGKDDMIINSASFNNEVVGYTGATTLTIYKNTISSSNIAGSGPISGVINFTSNNTIQPGETVKYIVTINGIPDASANFSTWTIRLTDLQFGGINASDYSNLGEFPIVEMK